MVEELWRKSWYKYMNSKLYIYILLSIYIEIYLWNRNKSHGQTVSLHINFCNFIASGNFLDKCKYVNKICLQINVTIWKPYKVLKNRAIHYTFSLPLKTSTYTQEKVIIYPIIYVKLGYSLSYQHWKYILAILL